MATTTSIEWTETVQPDGTVTPGKSWNPTTGCTQISPGCARCYAKTIAGRFWKTQHPPVLDGMEFRPREFEDVQLHPDRLDQPRKWTNPAKIFVDSMSDLFHEDVPESFIALVMATMMGINRHTYLVLTKRHQRMRDLLMSEQGPDAARAGLLRNIRFGVSIENRVFAARRFPAVCDLGEAGFNTMVSLEPLLEEVRIPARYLALGPRAWVIIGGESGPRARPFLTDWANSVIDHCDDAGVAVFMKQVGSNPHTREFVPREPFAIWHPLKVRGKGGDPAAWPKHLRVRQWPGDIRHE